MAESEERVNPPAPRAAGGPRRTGGGGVREGGDGALVLLFPLPPPPCSSQFASNNVGLCNGNSCSINKPSSSQAQFACPPPSANLKKPRLRKACCAAPPKTGEAAAGGHGDGKQPPILPHADILISRSFHPATMAKDAGSKAAASKAGLHREEAGESHAYRSSSNGGARVSLKGLIMAKERSISCSHDTKGGRSNAEPALGVAASLQKTPSPLDLPSSLKHKPAIAMKPAQQQNRDTSYGCFSCRSADVNFDSIVRL